jgi:hypothetical protein
MTKEIVTVLAAKPGPAAHIDRLLAVCQRERLSVAQTAYVLATAHHESRMGLVMLDRASGWACEGHMHLGNVQPGDGPRFRGRGYILLIGRTSYLRWARYLDQPLVDQPGLAAEPEVAAEILVLGMKCARPRDAVCSSVVCRQRRACVRALPVRGVPHQREPTDLDQQPRHSGAATAGTGLGAVSTGDRWPGPHCQRLPVGGLQQPDPGFGSMSTPVGDGR